MKIITKPYKPRRTDLMARIAEAYANGVKVLQLRTAVDVYGAVNIQAHVRLKYGVNTQVAYEGSNVVMRIGPRGKSNPPQRNHAKLRKVVSGLGRDQCLLLTTPLEAWGFMITKAALRAQGITVRCMRNCNNLMVWKR